MTLEEKIKSDLVQALKEKDGLRSGTLRLVLSATHNLEIEKKGKSEGKEVVLGDDEVLEVLRKEAKKRKEAIEMYKKGKRGELAEKEEKELNIIEEYLPSQMNEEEIVKILDETMVRVKPGGPADFGKVMGDAMKQLKGKADAQMVAGLIKKKLEGVHE
ncbi:MAG: GatB/YqeY domain-containing protein [Patescibacteria group bacterium]|nr:GatB/YqeY domain-containing protein [Patescibacteria group bacterium]